MQQPGTVIWREFGLIAEGRARHSTDFGAPTLARARQYQQRPLTT
jgi:hypothetical protein